MQLNRNTCLKKCNLRTTAVREYDPMEISKRIQNDVKKDHTALRRKNKENENDKNKEDERGLRKERRNKKIKKKEDACTMVHPNQRQCIIRFKRKILITIPDNH